MVKSALVFLIVIVALTSAVFLGEFIFNHTYKFPHKITYGVSFSPGYATFLGLDWKVTYLNVLNDLKVKNLRLPSYWDEIEREPGKLNFETEDFMLDQAGKAGAKVLLVVGLRQPRWPECHAPYWASVLSSNQRQQELLQFIRTTVNRYKDNHAVEAFQVENEPFLPFFGENCPQLDINFLKQEIALVRGLTKKPIVVSDSGELGNWILPMQLSDIFGTSVYRDVYNPVMGYFSYPILPYLYNLKSSLVRLLAPNNRKTIIVELQTEPWFADGSLDGKANLQVALFPLNKFKSYVNYAQETGFDSDYLWGVEWWYWMEKSGYPEYVQYAKTLFK